MSIWETELLGKKDEGERLKGKREEPHSGFISVEKTNY